MYLLSKSNKEVSRSRSLTDEEISTLKVFSAIGSPAFIKKQELLSTVHSENYWIECDCCTDKSAMMGVRHRETYYHLFNMSKRGTHKDDCPLHRLPKENAETDREIKKAEIKKDSFIFHFSKRETVQNKEINNIGGAKKAVKAENSLWVCLRRILTLAGIDKIGVGIDYIPLTETARKQAILRTIRSLKLGGLPMSKVSKFGLDKADDLTEIVTLLTEKGSMPKGAAHGIMISVLDEIKMNDKNQVVLIDGSSYVAMPNSCQIQINGKRGVENGPYVVIYTIVNTSQVDEEVLCEPQKAYILHVHSRDSLIPTSSDLERTLIEKSISNVRYNHSKGNNIISFEKPLYPYVSPISGRNVMPSLVVKGSGEVFIDIDYQVSEESKINCEKRLEAMNEITSLIRIPVCDSDESFDKESFKAVSEAAKYILGIGRE